MNCSPAIHRSWARPRPTLCCKCSTPSRYRRARWPQRAARPGNYLSEMSAKRAPQTLRQRRPPGGRPDALPKPGTDPGRVRSAGPSAWSSGRAAGQRWRPCRRAVAFAPDRFWRGAGPVGQRRGDRGPGTPGWCSEAENHAQAKELERLKVEKLLTESLLNQGLALCQKGEVSWGLLVLALPGNRHAPGTGIGAAQPPGAGVVAATWPCGNGT